MRGRLLVAVATAGLGAALAARADPPTETRADAAPEVRAESRAEAPAAAPGDVPEPRVLPPTRRAVREAAPRIELSGFVGVDWFGERTSLGDSWAAEQVPRTSPVIGARAGWLALPALPGDVELALEAELGFAPAFTGSTTSGGGRAAYFAPVLEWRGQAVLRFAGWGWIVPHLALGAGGDSVSSSSPFMADDTDPIAYWGAGITARGLRGWHLRLDVHHGVMPARSGGVHSTAELAVGLGIAFGAAERRVAHEPAAAPIAAAAPAGPITAPPPAPPVDRDSDGDGIVDRLDACPDQPGAAADGCAAPDPDGDGIVGDADRCPDQPEDADGFQDDDGCPDPDNDGDGIEDGPDACPDQPETYNGWQDGDGCPDEIPAEVRAALSATVRFEPGRARVTDAAAAPLRALYAVLDQHPEVRLAIIGHAERAGSGEELAKRRADAVKWRLVDLGIPEDQVVARVGAVAGPPAITFQLIAPRP